jgi:hypothetical protein
MYHLIALPFFLEYLANARYSSGVDLLVETPTCDQQTFRLPMDLNLKQGYWIEFCMNLITICLALLVKWYNNRPIQLLEQLIFIRNRLG